MLRKKQEIIKKETIKKVNFFKNDFDTKSYSYIYNTIYGKLIVIYLKTFFKKNSVKNFRETSVGKFKFTLLNLSPLRYLFFIEKIADNFIHAIKAKLWVDNMKNK